MKFSLGIWAAMSGALLLAGCEHAENYRWSSASKPQTVGMATPPAGSEFPTWNTPSVAVYSYPTPGATSPAASPAKLSIKDLSDHGQAALVEALTKSGANAKTVMSSIATSGATDSSDISAGAATVEGSYNQTLVATVTKGLDAGPGDRLAWTWIDIRPLNFRFNGYTVIATDNESLNIEQIQNQTTASLQGQAGETTSNTSATTTTVPPVSNVLTKVLGSSLGATANLSNQYTTSAAINQQYMKLGADILPGELRIYRESERNLDVAGNTVIALTLQVTPERWRSLRQIVAERVTKLTLADTTTGALLAPADVTLQASLDESPPSCPLLADVTLLYNLRHITGNARSYVEGEQQVEFRQDAVVSRKVVIAAAGAVRKPSWWIYSKGDQNRQNPVMLREGFDEVLPLDFSSYEQARDFAQWMNQNAGWLQTDHTRKIGKAGLTLTSANADGFPTGPYFADSYQDPNLHHPYPADTEREAECARMEPAPATP